MRWAAGGLLLALGVAAAVIEIGLQQTEPLLRVRLIEELETHFHARVELDSFHVSFVKGLWAEGKGLRIYCLVGGNQPLISADEFRFHAPIHYRPSEPIHVTMVELKGLRADLPPKEQLKDAAAASGISESAAKPRAGLAKLVSFELDRIECDGAKLVMETSKPGKLPLEFEFAHINLSGISSTGPIGFDAELTNPRPKGTIKTTGSIDALHTADLGESPIEGSYSFEHADLSTFRGIAGTLSSTGHFKGTLRDLVVDGQTETPDFRLTHFGSPLLLKTSFHARVDGTNGDTWLEPVDATLDHSHLTATGQVVRVMATEDGGAPHSIGHEIDLRVYVDKGRIEDFLRLASHSGEALMSGDLALKTTLEIPPGPEALEDRLNLNGWFSLDNSLFTSEKIQGRIAELSLRGQGRPDELKKTDPSSILSRMQSNFTLEDGVVTLPALDYTVPGAKIELKGAYSLEGGGLNFDGSAKMQASVSRMVGGWKGVLLAPADPFFRKDGAGTEVPIHIKGTREKPEFGIEFEKMKLSEKQQ